MGGQIDRQGNDGFSFDFEGVNLRRRYQNPHLLAGGFQIMKKVLKMPLLYLKTCLAFDGNLYLAGRTRGPGRTGNNSGVGSIGSTRKVRCGGRLRAGKLSERGYTKSTSIPL